MKINNSINQFKFNKTEIDCQNVIKLFKAKLYPAESLNSTKIQIYPLPNDIVQWPRNKM